VRATAVALKSAILRRVLPFLQKKKSIFSLGFENDLTDYLN
jgi:hypothetical protein